MIYEAIEKSLNFIEFYGQLAGSRIQSSMSDEGKKVDPRGLTATNQIADSYKTWNLQDVQDESLQAQKGCKITYWKFGKVVRHVDMNHMLRSLMAPKGAGG